MIKFYKKMNDKKLIFDFFCLKIMKKIIFKNIEIVFILINKHIATVIFSNNLLWKNYVKHQIFKKRMSLDS